MREANISEKWVLAYPDDSDLTTAAHKALPLWQQAHHLAVRYERNYGPGSYTVELLLKLSAALAP